MSILVRRKEQGNARLWLPPVANILFALFIQHGCELLSSVVPGFWFQMDAVFLMFPLLYLRYAHAIPQVVLTALALDAFWPGPYGTRLVIYMLLFLCLLPYRTRVRRENPIQVFAAAALTNLITFSALWIVASFSLEGLEGVSAWRGVGDMLLSSLVAGALSYGWLEFQRKAIMMVSNDDPAGYPILY